ncbi:MAG TPA: FtsX-like permease family protein [Myxococcota bacterium]|nr:FtsX-like permease family protein [Myxococcota bacterium]
MSGPDVAQASLLAQALGAVALAFIVALLLAIAANSLLFFGSAVVVLERFARSRKRALHVLAISLVWAALLGLLGTDEETVESLGIRWPGFIEAWAGAAFLALALVALAQGFAAIVLRLAPPRGLAYAAIVLLGLAFSAYAGSLAQVGYVALPAALSAAIAIALRVRRTRAGAEHAGADERLAGLLALALLPGIPFALALEAPRPDLGVAGALTGAAFAAIVVLGLAPLAAAGFLGARGSAEWFIARRYMFAKRRQTFISVITGICVAGVAAGVWLIITVLSVMNGFENVWREEIIGNRAHLTVFDIRGLPIERYESVIGEIREHPDVIGASPYLDAEGMIRGPNGEIVGVRVRGIDPQRIGEVTDLKEDLLWGSEDALAHLGVEPGSDGEEAPGILLGSQLALNANVSPGDSIVVISPFGGPPTPLGPGPRLKRFRVAGLFETSFFQYDEVFTYVDLSAARDFRKAGDVVDGIEVRTSDFYRSRQVATDLQQQLGFPYAAKDWKEFFPAFFQALKTERVMMFVLLTMIMVVAAFAIVVTLIMMIMEKSSDIAILKTMGATDAAIERVFAIEGTLIGLLGTVAGVIAGIAVTTRLPWVQEQIERISGIDVLPANIYQFGTLPWEIDPGQVAIVVGIAMVLALGATLLPSRHGAKLDPAEALRAE